MAKIVTLPLRSTDGHLNTSGSGEAIATLVKVLVKKIAIAEAISSVDPIIAHHTCLTGGWFQSNLSNCFKVITNKDLRV